MEITSFALFGWSMALASILFFIFIYKKVRRTTATGAGLRSNDGSADPDVKIVGQDEKYKRATWGICIGASIIVGPMLGFALGLALKLVIPTYYHIEDTTPNGHYTCYAIKGNIGKELFGKTSSIIPTKNIIFAGRTISTELQTTRQPTSRPLHHTAPHLSPWKLTDGFTPSPPASPTITEEAQMPWTIMTKTCTIFSRSHNLTKYSANSSRRAFISQSEEQSQLHFTRKQNDIRGKSNGVGIFLIKYL